MESSSGLFPQPLLNPPSLLPAPGSSELQFPPSFLSGTLAATLPIFPWTKGTWFLNTQTHQVLKSPEVSLWQSNAISRDLWECDAPKSTYTGVYSSLTYKVENQMQTKQNNYVYWTHILEDYIAIEEYLYFSCIFSEFSKFSTNSKQNFCNQNKIIILSL